MREYLIRWTGYGPEHNTWEPQSNMAGAAKGIAEYRALIFKKARNCLVWQKKEKETGCAVVTKAVPSLGVLSLDLELHVSSWFKSPGS